MKTITTKNDYNYLRSRVLKTGHRLTRSRKKIEREWNAGYRISDRNNFLVAGFYGYGLNPEEVKNSCDEQEQAQNSSFS